MQSDPRILFYPLDLIPCLLHFPLQSPPSCPTPTVMLAALHTSSTGKESRCLSCVVISFVRHGWCGLWRAGGQHLQPSNPFFWCYNNLSPVLALCPSDPPSNLSGSLGCASPDAMSSPFTRIYIAEEQWGLRTMSNSQGIYKGMARKDRVSVGR